MKIGSAERGVCPSCNCEHYYQTDTCENAMKRKKATRIDMHNWGNPDNPAVVYSYQEHIRSLESRVKDIESAWQDAELRADKAEARVEELESRLTLSYAIDLENKVRRLERIVEVAKMVNPLAPETIYKLIEELER